MDTSFFKACCQSGFKPDKFFQVESSGNVHWEKHSPGKSSFSLCVLSFSRTMFKWINLTEKCSFIMQNNILISSFCKKKKKLLPYIVIHIDEMPHSAQTLTWFFLQDPLEWPWTSEWMALTLNEIKALDGFQVSKDIIFMLKRGFLSRVSHLMLMLFGTIYILAHFLPFLSLFCIITEWCFDWPNP